MELTEIKYGAYSLKAQNKEEIELLEDLYRLIDSHEKIRIMGATLEGEKNKPSQIEITLLPPDF